MAVHVLWVIKGLGPGGAERLLVALAGAHDPEVATFECAFVVPWKDHLVADLEARGVRCHCLSARRRDPRWPLRLARLVRSRRFDVVHVHSPLPGGVGHGGEDPRLRFNGLTEGARPGALQQVGVDHLALQLLPLVAPAGGLNFLESCRVDRHGPHPRRAGRRAKRGLHERCGGASSMIRREIVGIVSSGSGCAALVHV